MRRSWFPKRYADFVARLRVPGGFLLVAAFAYLSRPDALSLASGVPISVLGLLIRGWAAGHLAKNERLATSGPYSYLRNPLYLGTLLAAAGLALASRRPALAVVFAVVFLFVYLPVIELEEQHLRKLFPQYADYASRVPMLWPRLRKPDSPAAPADRPAWPDHAQPPKFRWRLYFRNQEYQALAGFLAGVLYLAWKVWR